MQAERGVEAVWMPRPQDLFATGGRGPAAHLWAKRARAAYAARALRRRNVWRTALPQLGDPVAYGNAQGTGTAAHRAGQPY